MLATVHRVWPYARSLIYVTLITAAIFPVRHHLNVLNTAFVYLIAIVAFSLRNDIWPSMLASVAAFVASDFFYVPPIYRLTIERPDHLLTLVVFLGVAIVITRLVVQARTRTEEELQRGRQTATLYDLSTALIGEVSLDATLLAITSRVREIFALDSCAIFIVDADHLQPRSVVGQSLPLNDPNLTALLNWVLETRQVAGIAPGKAQLRPPGPPGASPRWNFARGNRDRPLLLFPIATSRRALGVLVVARRPGRPRVSIEESRLLETFANQAAIAIERSLLSEEQSRADLLARSDALKSALLSAVSHDLRTPLTSIKAAATSLLQPGAHWTTADRRDLLEAINEETDRLNRLVESLLDLSRVEAGELRPELDWFDLREAIYHALDQSERVLRDLRVDVSIEQALPPLRFDFVMIGQVLTNLLENTAKYSPPGSRIALSASRSGESVEVAVQDVGAGIPAGEEERIFDKFYRVDAPNRPLGSGIGLAICRGFVEAHGGRIWAMRNAERGMTVRFTLPLPSTVEAPATDALTTITETGTAGW
ncbi:MAG TPA: ATP-binding protein [Thermomicrobiaceae bacterium]|nr:ATP-binding protein [Thermomicrobiaceae bacterium]